MTTATTATTAMTTAYATEILRAIYRVDCDLSGHPITMAELWLDRARAAAKQQSWGGATRCLSAAYESLGATPPAIDYPTERTGAGYEFYHGTHSIQA